MTLHKRTLLPLPALALGAALLWPAPQAMADSWASGTLAAGRNDTLWCAAINESSEGARIHVFLRDDNGNDVEDRFCTLADETPPGGTCDVSEKNPSPIPIRRHCHVDVFSNSVISGNLRHDNPNGVTQTSSDLHRVSQISDDDDN